MEDFANYLYHLRTRKGRYVSQQTLSRLSGYSQTYLSLLETGKAQPSKRCKKAILESLVKPRGKKDVVLKRFQKGSYVL